MRLGDSFDYSSFKVGASLVQSDVRNNAIKRRNDQSYMKFKLIKSQKDKKDVLDISGELSLKVMAGLVDVQGKGAYLKSTTKSSNSVELLVQIYYRTVSFLNFFYRFFSSTLLIACFLVSSTDSRVQQIFPVYQEKVHCKTHIRTRKLRLHLLLFNYLGLMFSLMFVNIFNIFYFWKSPCLHKSFTVFYSINIFLKLISLATAQFEF